MTRYLAIVDGGGDVYGAVIPDLPGMNGGGATPEAALADAAAVFPTWAELTERKGGALPPPRTFEQLLADPEVQEQLAASEKAFWAYVNCIREAGRSVKANLSIDASVLAAIDAEADRRHITRSAMVELLAKVGLDKVA